VGIVPSQIVESPAQTGNEPAPVGIPAILLAQLWDECEAGACELTRDEFSQILLCLGASQNYGQPLGADPSPDQQAAFLRSLKLSDLALARACAAGRERAWERFLALYHQPLTRAAIAIAGSDTLGRELADALYAELYGLSTRDGNRRCPLDSYKGRGSLLGWLRTTLAQRHVDHHRRTFREQPLDGRPDALAEFDHAASHESQTPAAELPILGKAIEDALCQQSPEDRFLLAAYYLDGRTQLQIAQILNVSESKISRNRQRVIDDLRKQVLRNLQVSGLSRRAAEEALGADPRDLDLNLKKLLQYSQTATFPEKAES